MDLTRTTVGFGLVYCSWFVLHSHLSLFNWIHMLHWSSSQPALVCCFLLWFSLEVSTKRNFLEWSSFLNLILLSAIYSALIEKPDLQQVVTIISVSVAFIIFLGVIIFHVLVRAKMISSLERFIKKFHYKPEDTRSLLDDDEDYVHHKLEQPTSSDVWLKRETLIF